MTEIRRFGSLIKVRPEYEERYIILHKHAFPGVLKQISACNIHSYSIFLHSGLLFSYYEYSGMDYTADMARMGQDQTTREWWKLTDPMQEPLEQRSEGEWWMTLPETEHFTAPPPGPGKTDRWAFHASEYQPGMLKSPEVFTYSAYRFGSCHFIYLESASGWDGLPELQNMKEVFHTD